MALQASRTVSARYVTLFTTLLAHFGPQDWWPAETLEELCIGAILTQNVAWANVEKALARLRAHGLLDLATLAAVSPAVLGEAIRPAGYYQVKARRLQAFARHCVEHYAGQVARLLDPRRPAAELREELLGIHGVGPETADCLLVYGAGQPAFIADTYGRRILARVGLLPPDLGYEVARRQVEAAWQPQPQQLAAAGLPARLRARYTSAADIWGEFHALLVVLGKYFCRRRVPRCQEPCPVAQLCRVGAVPRGPRSE